jgi:hypothetical protein
MVFLLSSIDGLTYFVMNLKWFQANGTRGTIMELIIRVKTINYYVVYGRVFIINGTPLSGLLKGIVRCVALLYLFSVQGLET